MKALIDATIPGVEKVCPERGLEAVVVGCGRSIGLLRNDRAALQGRVVIACNRAIEIVPADYWIWVDRMHYERSKWHPHARRARKVGPEQEAASFPEGTWIYRTARELPCGDESLFLCGGTLTLAAHLAIRLGVRRLLFLGCDPWHRSARRYHAWDGKDLSEIGLEQHESHLQNTVFGLSQLARAHPGVEFRDATVGERFLGLPGFDLGIIGSTTRDTTMSGESGDSPFPPDQNIALGFGALVAVTPGPEGDVILWLTDSGGTIRAVRMGQDFDGGLALAIKGHACITRS